MKELTIEFLADMMPRSIIEGVVKNCMIESIGHEKERSALREIIIFLNAISSENGMDEKSNTLLKYRKAIQERIIEVDNSKDGFNEDHEELESIFSSDATELDVPLCKQATSVLFRNLYALEKVDYGEEWTTPRFLIEFHIAMLWDEGMWDESLPDAVDDVYRYYY